ncbi:MAG TPA: RraA family protein [Terriglobales bacterium]|nr:RraA family protein [Terriglobales bacterium]
MNPAEEFRSLTTPLVADACVRLLGDVRVAPAGLRALLPGSTLAGPSLYVKHYGSVDVFLEACDRCRPGDVLVVDNDGRLDEGCLGDLSALEARAAGFSGIFIWGAHRDTADLVRIALPLFSYGSCPAGPVRSEAELVAGPGPRSTSLRVEDGDWVFADADGAVFVAGARIEDVMRLARQIYETEREQARLASTGVTLRRQFQWDAYLAKRAADPAYTLRKHLRTVGRAIEE